MVSLRERIKTKEKIKKSKEKKFKIDKNNMASIDVRLGSAEDLFLSFSTMDGNVVNSEIANYIEKQSLLIPKNYGVKINFFIKNHKDEDSEKIKTAIRSRVLNEVYELQNEYAYNNKFSLIMILVALIPFGISVLLKVLQHDYYYNAFLEILTWVFTWGAVEGFFIKRKEIKSKILRKFKIIESEINVIKD